MEINNLLDIDLVVEDFLVAHAAGIATMNKIYFSETSELANRALAEELKEELRNGCVTYFNKEDAEINGLFPYLFYVANAACKKRVIEQQVKKKTEYICPGCLFLGKDSLVMMVNKFFRCEDCEEELRYTHDPKMMMFYRTFFKHNKNGYRCQDCERFIPHPTDESPIVSCPYLDCSFIGSWSSLSRMHHPNSQTKTELLILDAKSKAGLSVKDSIVAPTISVESQIEKQEILLGQISILREVIDSQKNNVPYSSSDATIKHKYLCYEAFDNILKKFPSEMVDYLLGGSRSGGFQCKIFQEYISLLEKSLPFTFKKNNKHYIVESLLDDNLTLFDGISEFIATINSKLEIKNGTIEFYIGGRKGAVAQPYYIGKLLSVLHKETKQSLMNNVVEYSFSKIKMKDIDPGTEVIVTHLRVPPHYQMGGMVYVNRLRKKIIDRARLLLNKEINE